MEASAFVVAMGSLAEGYTYTFLHNHKERWKCVGVMRNGERLQKCSTKPFVYRVPLKKIQGLGHSSKNDHQKLQTDLTAILVYIW